MVRLVGVDLPRNKRIGYALTYIHGIGLTSAKKIIGLDISAGMLEVGKQKIEAKKLTEKIEMVLFKI